MSTLPRMKSLVIKQGKHLFIFLMVLALFVFQALSQTKAPQARKFDEFNTGIGTKVLRYRPRNYEEERRELAMRAVRYARQLRLEKAKPYIITYSPRVIEWEIYNRSIAEMRSGEMKSQLSGLGFDYQSIPAIDGGFREEPTTELWIVPLGAEPPKPTPTVKKEEVIYCPQVWVKSTPFLPSPTELIKFNADVNVNNSTIEPSYNWQVSNGRIVKGQGSKIIEVKPTKQAGKIIAKVNLEGFSTECSCEDTTSTGETVFGVPHFKLEEFGFMHSGEAKARLDNLISHLQANPFLQAYIVHYAGRSDVPGTAKRRNEILKKYLLFRNFPADRITFLEGGFRDALSGEFWLSANNAGPPPLNSTIDKKYTRQK
jgi:hypothetical protein